MLLRLGLGTREMMAKKLERSWACGQVGKFLGETQLHQSPDAWYWRDCGRGGLLSFPAESHLGMSLFPVTP